MSNTSPVILDSVAQICYVKTWNNNFIDSDERLRRVRESGAEGANAILSQAKGTGPGRKSGKRTGAPVGAVKRTVGATGPIRPGISQVHEQRRNRKLSRLRFLFPAPYQHTASK